MNYGEFFLESYNNKFLERKKDFVNYLEENYDSHETYDELYIEYIGKLHEHIKEIEDIICWRLIEDCYSKFNARYLTCRKKPMVNVVQNKIFDEYKTYNKNPEIDFNSFCNYASTIFLIRDFESLLKREKNKIKTAFEIESTKGLLKLKKNNFGEYLLNPEILPKAIEKNIKQKELDSNKYNNPFNIDEKFIITNFFIDIVSKNRDVLSRYEEIIIIKLIADIYVNKSFNKQKDTFYEKYVKGINYTTKNNLFKKKQLEGIIQKSKKFDIPKFIQYLESELNKM